MKKNNHKKKKTTLQGLQEEEHDELEREDTPSWVQEYMKTSVNEMRNKN